jgi:hypothetical protein
LTIQAGVTINLGGNSLEVNGTLAAIGTESNKIQINAGGTILSTNEITFTPVSNGWNEQTHSGSIIQYAVFNQNTVNLQSPAKIDYNIFNGNPMWYSGIGASCGIVSNNTFYAGYGAEIGCSGNATILDNTVIGGVAVSINVGDGNPIVQGNLVIGNTGDPVNGNGGGAIRVTNNALNSQRPLIQYNTLTNNNVGITFGQSTGLPVNATILNNNVFNNNNGAQKKNVYLVSSTTSPNLINNWWGTTDNQAINQTIYDSKNNYNLGTVNFVPFLTVPNPQAPTYINASAGSGGSISSSGITHLIYGSSQTFNMNPNSGYHIADVLVNGTSVGAVNSFSLQNVTGATTISALFALNPTVTPTPTPSPTPSPATTAPPTQAPIQTTSPTSPPASSNPTATPTTNPTSQPTPTPSPSRSASPSPTSTVPEFPTWIAIALVVGVTLLFIALKKNR